MFVVAAMPERRVFLLNFLGLSFRC